MTDNTAPAADALAADIVSRVREVLHTPTAFTPLHEPEFEGNEEALVLDCIRTGWVSSVGKYVDEFEAKVAEACGARFGIAVANGTAALQVALRLVGVGAGDEVLMPTLTFIATANAASHLGAVPHFVDSETGTLGLDPHALRNHLNRLGERRDGVLINRMTGRRLAAIAPMHVFGHPVDMDALSAVSAEFGLPIVEDAAEALGSLYKGQKCGGLGLVGALSFNGNKIVTTGGGGAILTNDEGLARRAKHLTTTAKQPHKWAFSHDEIAYNYRMPNLNAALGVAQLAQLPDRVAKKRRLATAYLDAFAGSKDVTVFAEPAGTTGNYWLNTLILAPHLAGARDIVLQALNDAGLMARPVWEPLHTLGIYADAPRAVLPVATDLAARIINVPSSAKLAV